MNLDTRTARTLLVYGLVRLAALVTAKLGVESVDTAIIEQLADAVILPLALYYLREAVKQKPRATRKGRPEERVG